MFSLPPSTFVEEYMMFFHISISWKYINSSTFNLCQKLCEVFHLPHLWKNTWYFSTFLFFGSIFILPLNICRGLCIVLNPHCGRIHTTFYITFLLKYIFLTRLTLWKIMFSLTPSTFLFCESIYIYSSMFLGNIPHLWKIYMIFFHISM